MQHSQTAFPWTAFVRTQRFPFFLASRDLSECRLCRELTADNARLAITHPHYKSTIGSVDGMARVLRGLHGTPGEGCWHFWLFADEYRNCVSAIDAADKLKRCHGLFIDDAAPHPLPPSIRQVRACGAMHVLM